MIIKASVKTILVTLSEVHLEGGPEDARAPFLQSLFYCHFEELETVLNEVKLIINNAPLTYVYPNTIKTCLNTQSFVSWQAVTILTQHQL